LIPPKPIFIANWLIPWRAGSGYDPADADGTGLSDSVSPSKRRNRKLLKIN
jgi:hypothetical protein